MYLWAVLVWVTNSERTVEIGWHYKGNIHIIRAWYLWLLHLILLSHLVELMLHQILLLLQKMLELLVRVHIFLGWLSLVLSLTYNIMVNKVKSMVVLKMIRLDLLISSKVIIIALRAVFLMRYRYVHGLLRRKRALSEVKIRAQVSEWVMRRVFSKILELEYLVKNLINLLLVWCTLRRGFVIVGSLHSLLSLYKIRRKYHLCSRSS